MSYAKKYIAGVYLEEGQQDLQIIPQASMSVSGLMFSTRGEVGVITQVNSISDMERIFGTPTDDNYQEWLPLARIFKYRVGSLSGILQIARVIGEGSTNGGLIVAKDKVVDDAKNQLINNRGQFDGFTPDFGDGDFKFVTRTPTEEKLKIALVSGKTKFETAMVDTVKGITFVSQFRYPLTKESEIAVVFLDEDGSILEKYQGELPAIIDDINEHSSLFYFFAKDKTVDDTNVPFSFEATEIKVGEVKAPTKAEYVKALKLFEDIEGVDINYMVVNEMVYDESITLCEGRQDCLFKGGIPLNFVVGVEEDKALQNCLTFASTTLPRASTYGEISANALYVYDEYAKKNRWINIGGDLTGLKIRANLNGDVWDSDAFLNRGKFVDVIAIAQRWGNGSIRELSRNKLVPVILKRNVGFLKWSTTNYTNKPTPLNHSEIRELCVYVWRSVRGMLQYFLGEKNDDFTRTLITNKVDRFLRDIKAGRGITKYYVRCDEQNNPEDLIAQNLLFIEVGFVPTFSIEEIVFGIQVSATGADLKVYARGAEIK